VGTGRRDKNVHVPGDIKAVRLPQRAISGVQNIGDRGQSEIGVVKEDDDIADCHADVGEVRWRKKYIMTKGEEHV